MADNDDNKTYNRTPMSASTRPAPQAAPVRTPEQQREMLALLKVSGSHNGKVSGESNDPAKAAIEKFQKANGLDPAKSSPDETLAKMREAVKNDPQAVARMKTFSGTPDQDNTYAIQYGLRAKGAMIVPNGRTTIDGKLDAQTATVLQGVEKAQLAAAQPATPTTTPTPAATATAGATPAPVPLVDLGTSPAAPQMGILQMIILIFAQAFGMNLTTLQQAGAQNRPPAVVSTAAPAAPVTARPPTPQPAPAPTAPTPAATPATATPVVAESEQAHCDRLGYSQQQYEKLKSDQQKWQADYDAGRPHKRLSPFKMADEADKLMQKEVGLEGNDAKWAALKKEQQKWQTDVDNKRDVSKTSPFAAAKIATSNPLVEPIAKDPAIRPAYEAAPQPLSGAGFAGGDLLSQQKRAFEATLTPEQKQILESAHQNRDGERLRSSREKENDWNDFEKQLSDDQKLIFQQISAQAYPDRAQTIARAEAFHGPDRMTRTQYNPATASSADTPAAVRGLTSRHEHQMQLMAQGDVGISGRNNPADRVQILDALRRQAENDPNFASKLDALSTMKVGIQIGTGPVKIDKAAYEVRIDPRDLARGAPVLDIAIGKVIEGKQFNVDSLKADAERGGYKLPPSIVREINRDQKDMDRLQSVLPEARVGRPVPAAPQFATQATPVPPRMPAPAQSSPMIYVTPAVTPSFNAASGLDDIMQRRDMRMAAIITTAQQISPSGRPVGIAAAERAVTAGRIQDLKNMGADSRDIARIVGEEKRVTQTEVSNLLKDERAGYAGLSARARFNPSIDQTIQRNSTDLRVGGQALGTLAGMRSGDARSVGNLLGAINGLVSRNNPEILSPNQETPNDRRNATDIRVGVQASGNLANMGSGPAAALGRLAGAVTGLGSRNNFPGSYDQSQYSVREFPQQREQNGYVPQPLMSQNFSYQPGLLKDTHSDAATYGVSEEARVKILRNYEAQRTTPTAEPTATTRQYRQPSPMDSFSGG